MDRLVHKRVKQSLRAARVRKIVRGSAERPRLSVNISHLHVSAQLINDDKQGTLAAATTVGNKKLSANLTERAVFVGTEIAKKAVAKKIKRVVLDRGSRLYHGRVKALAEAARAGGLEF